MSNPRKKSRADRAREVALYRYSLIRPLADPGLSPAERGRLVRELAAQVHIGPFGEPVTVSRASLDRWIRALRAGGVDALTPAEHHPAARTDAEVLELAARLKRERPARTEAHIARIIEREHRWATERGYFTPQPSSTATSRPCARSMTRNTGRAALIEPEPEPIAQPAQHPVRISRPHRCNRPIELPHVPKVDRRAVHPCTSDFHLLTHDASTTSHWCSM